MLPPSTVATDDDAAVPFTVRSPSDWSCTRVPLIAPVTCARLTINPFTPSATPSISVIVILPAVVCTSSVCNETSRSVIPVAAVTTRCAATISTTESSCVSRTVPVDEVSVTVLSKIALDTTLAPKVVAAPRLLPAITQRTSMSPTAFTVTSAFALLSLGASINTCAKSTAPAAMMVNDPFVTPAIVGATKSTISVRLSAMAELRWLISTLPVR